MCIVLIRYHVKTHRGKMSTGSSCTKFRNYKELTHLAASFFYIDGWLDSFKYYDKDIRENHLNPLYRTLGPIYNKPPVSYAMNIDQPSPRKTASQKHGHSKEGIFNITIPFLYDKKGVGALSSEPSISNGHLKLTTVRGTTFEVFAKSSEKNLDIYSGLIGSEVQRKLLVHTWNNDLRGTRWVMNVYDICFDNGLEFHSGIDHSKWAVSTSNQMVCIGDLNRQETQFYRGGISLCFNNRIVAKSFRNLYTNCFKKKENGNIKKWCANQKKKNLKTISGNGISKKIKKTKINRL
uniref:Deoxyribonuclease-2-alpha-like n=1 Tax=Crassostrea virginica TaxID=6565 RepID=A0A8B8DJQ0_CRAVI|nr:deoxyribonuclease-2-alpha-like [Crassostrea virginica]